MRQVNVHEAKTHLSRLIAEAASGRPFVIARAGRPIVEVRAVSAQDPATPRIGFLPTARDAAPIKSVGADEVDAMFHGG